MNQRQLFEAIRSLALRASDKPKPGEEVDVNSLYAAVVLWILAGAVVDGSVGQLAELVDKFGSERISALESKTLPTTPDDPYSFN